MLEKRHSGKVTWFNVTNGYGFLACAHAADVFVDAAEQKDHLLVLEKGDRVFFEIVESDMGPTARSVVKYDGRTPVSRSACRHLATTSSQDGRLLLKAGTVALKTILIIEDNDELRAVRSDFLSAAGYLVAACNDVQLAASIYASGLSIDLIIMDLWPQKRLGAHLAELNSLSPEQPVLLSARVFPIDLWREMLNRRWHFVATSTPLPTLLSRVYSLLRLAHQQAA